MTDFHGWTHGNGIDPIPGRFTIVLVYPDDPVVADASSSADTVFRFTVPSDLDKKRLKGAEAWLATASSSGVVQVDVYRGDDPTATDAALLDDPLTIDAGEYTSRTAATPVSFTGELLAAGDFVFVVVSAEGTGAKGLGVHLVIG